MAKSLAKFKNLQKGQSLITLLIFVSTAIIITSGAVTVTIINSQTTSRFTLGEEAYTIAEAGADNAILRILRNPAYAGETLAVGGGTATVTATGDSTRTITSEGISGSHRRKIQVVGNYANNTFTISSWGEID